ncbi:DUF4127 family protein [Sutcliffiella rhizosphaerae]|uniref:DUF4127 family protein n=1 Tax=Sutcliffiella rhizosphaerae TaxID=2880967 RepID=A0ABM8YMC6_9BACI|nr:DUF4127 family protein [Sutcliffiella rhizosphaerae]CAG9621146.1 hypothetical protein BACCIP111883_01918 [Sutcliffiella rhizosphaerae]
MKKVIYLPLDERPCNLRYPKMLADMTDMTMVVPNKDILGNMKVAAKVSALHDWLREEAFTANYLIVSIDMLLYGGIVPSRLHKLSMEQCMERLAILQELKSQNPNLKIYGYSLIMRVPAYNSSEEEPDYYEEIGEKIYRLGWLTDKKEQNLATESELKEFVQITESLSDEVKNDYFSRRMKNFSVTKQALQMVEDNTIEYLIIPLDDNSEYGFTAIEQRQLVIEVDTRSLLDQVAIYPGADEIGCTLFSRVFCVEHNYTPEISVRYSSTNGPFIIPRYEDRSLSESIKSHITAAGGVIVADEKENDVLLMVHASAVGQKHMAESSHPLESRHRTYSSEVNIREFAQAMKHFIAKGRNVALADVAICNGGDHSLLQLLEKQGTLYEIMAYAGWNTNGNTMGTVVSHAIISSFYKKDSPLPPLHTRLSRAFFYARLVEDWGYQSIVRKYISYQLLPELGLTPRFLQNQVPQITEKVSTLLNSFVKKNLTKVPEGKIMLEEIHLPWRRVFEVGFTISVKDGEVRSLNLSEKEREN